MKLFISHSSINNAHALALEQWLIENGWGDSYYLDVSESRGIIAGDRWQDALKKASHSCEAVIFLISRPWQESKWCLAEFLLAKQLGKKIFGVLVEDVTLDSLPREMTVEWRICDLVTGQETQEYEVARDPLVPETRIKFATAGLKDLRLGLGSAGIGADTFPWPPASQPDRSPYPGLRALKAEDAAIFFGRDALIMRCIDEIRKMQDGGINNVLVILGASGSGKSSFMRAGVYPRLNRDQHRFITLATVRPRRDAFNSEEGLVYSLQAKCRDVHINKNLGEIKASVGDPARLKQLLTEIATRWVGGEITDKPRHLSFVLPIDQAEELYTQQSTGSSSQFLSVISSLLQMNSFIDAPNQILDLIVLLTIRTDLFEYVQQDRRFDPDQRQIIDLPAMDTTQYKAVIEGPALLSTRAGRKLDIEPALTDQLLAETRGADALPLLAFTMERLFRDYGEMGHLTLSEYQMLGGIQGSISAAVEEALDQPNLPPVIPEGKTEQLQLLKQTFIPWLADVDEESREHRRRIADLADMPAESINMIERLIDKRLLIKDVAQNNAASAKVGENRPITTVEVAHEALLRHWPDLVEWLHEEGENLTVIYGIERARDCWLKEGCDEDWLEHSGMKLERAEQVLGRPSFAQRVGSNGKNYLLACRKKETEAAEREKQHLQIIANQQAKTAKQQKGITLLLGALLVATVIVGGWQVKTRMDTVELQAGLLASSSRSVPENDPIGTGLRLALASVQRNFLRAPSANVVNNLNRAVEQTRLLVRIQAHSASVYHGGFSPDGQRVVTGSADGSARLWSLGGSELLRVEHPGVEDQENLIVYAAFSPDGRRFITSSYDGTARVWNTSGDSIHILQHNDRVWHGTYSPDGQFIATASEDGTGRIWNSETGTLLFVIQHSGPVNHIAFSPDSSRVITASFDGSSQLWTTAGEGRFLFEIRHAAKVNHAVFSPDGKRIVTSSGDHTARVWASDGSDLFAVQHEDEVWHAAFSADSRHLATASFDKTARVWDENGNQLFQVQHDDWVTLAEFSPDAKQLLTISGDRYAILWDAGSGERIFVMQHDRGVRHATFSPDGDRVVTTSADNTAALWDSKVETRFRLSHDQAVTYAAFSPDNELLATVSDDGNLYLWNQAGEKVLSHFVGTGGRQVIFSPSGERIASSFAGGLVQVLSRAASPVFEFNDFGQASMPLNEPGGSLSGSVQRPAEVTHIEFSSTGRFLAVSSEDGFARILDGNGSVVVLLRHDGIVHHVTFSSDEKYLATASEDNTARLWDIEGNLIFTVSHSHRVTHAAFSSDGTMLITGSTDETARVLSVPDGELLLEVTHIGNISESLFSPDNNLVVLASDDHTVQAWSLDGDSQFILQHSNPVTHVEFSADGTRLLTASEDDTSRVWDITGEELYVVQHNDNVSHAAFSPDGQRIVTTGRDGMAYVTFTGWLAQRSWQDALIQTCAKWPASSGVTTITVEDIRASGLLSGREGEDLCEGYR